MLDAALALAAPGGFAAAAALSYAAPELIRRRSVAARRAVAGAAAAGAFFAHTEPTTVAAFDAVLAPAFAAGVTLIAARSRPWATASAALAVALLSIGAPNPTLAFAAAGASLAIALTARRSPVVTAVVAAAAVNAALRLRLPGPSGLESLATMAALVPVAVSGYTRLQRGTRRRVRNAAFVLGGVTVVASLAGALALLEARPHLERAVARAGAGLAAARLADQATAADALDAASASFERADVSLGAFWSRPAFAVPILGAHLRALHTAAATGQELADAGRSVALAADLGGTRITDGQLPLDRIAALHEPIARAAAQVETAERELRDARSEWLLPAVRDPLDDNLDRLADAEQSLRASADVTRVLPALLGADGPRRWFLAVQTPSEGRAAGGFIGNYGEIVADRGKLSLARFGRIGELNVGGPNKRLTGPDDYIARYERFAVASTWQNVTMSPDFPSVAKVIGGLYPQSGGQPVDGVIAIDPLGVAALLQLTGPLTVAPWPEPLTPDNAARVLLYEQYVQIPNADRADFLGRATELLWQRLTSGELPAPAKMLAALGPAVAGKHVMVSSLKDDEDRVLASVDVNGSFAAPASGDSLAVMTQNATASKIEWFLRRELDYRPTFSDGAFAGALRITLHNDAPPAGLPAYLIGNTIGLPQGTNRVYLSVYTPWSLDKATLEGKPYAMESERELGHRVYSAYVDIPSQGKTTVELTLSGTYDADEYRLAMQLQPVVTPDKVTVMTADTTRSFVLDRARSFRTSS